MQAMRVIIQLHKMAEVLLKFGPSTHDDTIFVFTAVKFPAAAESSSPTGGELCTKPICAAKQYISSK